MIFKNLKAIAFDLDGTLYSSEMMLAKCYQDSLLQLKKKYDLSFSIPTNAEFIRLIGLPGFTIFQSLVPPEAYPYYEYFKEINTARINHAVRSSDGQLMAGVPELLDFLHKKKITACMASNGSHRYLKNIMDTYHLTFYNPIISLNYNNIQTKSDILEEYLTILQIKPSEMIMIGDRYLDLEAAKANKVFFIGLKSGIGYTIDPKELAEADLILDDIQALHQFLDQKIDG